MNATEAYPYRSAESRDLCLRYLDHLAARQWPVASEERLIPTAFGDTFVRISGPPAAPWLFLLHGAAATSLMWAPSIEVLSRHHRTVAVDQIGEFGRSVCTRPIQTLDDLMAWLHSLIGALAPAVPVSLAGMSYGGALAAQFALRFPERLRKVVLLAPGATVLRPPIAFWLRLMVLAVRRQKGLPAFFRWVFPEMARKDPQWIASTVELLSMNMQHVRRHKLPIPPVMTDAQWSRLLTPTLFLCGESEVIYSAARAVRRLRRVAPSVTSGIIPGAGHDLVFSQAACVNDRILQFLNSGSALP